MPIDTSAYVNHCHFCGDGLLRLRRCQSCQQIAAICDECELTWADVAAVHHDAKRPASDAFPACPHCSARQPDWSILSTQEISGAGLAGFVVIGS